MSKSMVLHFWAGALADFPTPEDADHVTLGPCNDGLWYRCEFGGTPAPVEGTSTAFKSATVTLVAGTYTVVFATPITAADYRISLTSNSDEVLHYENKADVGFDIVSSDGGSTSDVDVIVTRIGTFL